MAIHPLMDAVSPAHRNWQVYSLTGIVPYDVYAAIVHKEIESREPTAAEMALMRQAIQISFKQVVSEFQYDRWVLKAGSR
jgi:hypothetical protein